MIVAKFLAWIETANTERRAEATSALARAYLYSELDAVERDAAETALTILLDDPAPMVRQSMAHALATSPYAPRQVILSLSQDVPDVAETVVAQSPVLLDAELVDLAADGSPAMQKAIASRPSMSAALSAAISEVADAEACVVMLENPGAQIAVFSLRRLAERLGSKAMVRNALLALPGLPVDIRQTLIVQLGDAFEQLALIQTVFSEEKRSAMLKDACDKATVNLAFCCAHGDELVALVEHLRLSGQLTADMLIRALCMGNVEFFVAAMVGLANMSEKRVRACVEDVRESIVDTMCRKAGISQRLVPAVYSALLAYRDLAPDLLPSASNVRFARLMVDRILSDYTGLMDDDLDDLHARLRKFATEIARDEAREMRQRIAQHFAA